MVTANSLRIVVRTRPRRRLPCAAVFVAACCLFAGCSNSNLVPVHGSVQNEGQLVTGGSVVLMPVGDGKPAIGPIQSDGTFQLTTYAPNDGALIGQYRVSVAGERNAETERTGTTFIGPPDLLLDVAAGKENELQIHIRKADGWQAAVGG